MALPAFLPSLCLHYWAMCVHGLCSCAWAVCVGWSGLRACAGSACLRLCWPPVCLRWLAPALLRLCWSALACVGFASCLRARAPAGVSVRLLACALAVESPRVHQPPPVDLYAFRTRTTEVQKYTEYKYSLGAPNLGWAFIMPKTHLNGLLRRSGSI